MTEETCTAAAVEEVGTLTPRLKAIAEAFSASHVAEASLERLAGVSKQTMPSVYSMTHIICRTAKEAKGLAVDIALDLGMLMVEPTLSDTHMSWEFKVVESGVTVFVSGALSDAQKSAIAKADAELAQIQAKARAAALATNPEEV